MMHTDATQQTMVAERPLKFEEKITVRTPIHRAYDVWQDFTRYPQFMSNVEEVRPVGGNRYHWVARIFGVKQEWDAEVTETTPDHRVAWQSVTGAPNAGTVTFTERAPGVTDVQVFMQYTPPAGTVGKALDKMTQTTQREVKEDLRNFKRQVSGETPEGLLQPEQGPIEPGSVLASLAGPAVGAAIGGASAGVIVFLIRPDGCFIRNGRGELWQVPCHGRTVRASACFVGNEIGGLRQVSCPARL